MKRLFKNKKIIIIIIAAVAVLVVAAVVVFLLRDKLFPKEESPVVEEPVPIEAPIQYVLGEVSVLAMPAGANVLVYEEEILSLAEQVAKAEAEEQEQGAVIEEEELAATEEEDAEAESEEEAAEEELPVAAAYRYEEMASPGSVVSAYTALLTTENMGFVIADENLKEAEELPDFEQSTGVAYLTWVVPKAEGDEETEQQAVAMRVEWQESTCTVTVELVPASLTKKPIEPSSTGGFAQTLTFSSAVDTVKAMHPSILELEGESMDAYRIYSRDGLVLINEQPCMRLDVYSYNAELKTNVAAGNYFLSADGLHLYRFNEKEQLVSELSMTGVQLAAGEDSSPATEGTADNTNMPEVSTS